jgi:hypothetical protein
VNRNRGYSERGLGGYGNGAWVAPYYLAYPDDFGYDDGDGYGDSGGGYVDQGVGPQVAEPDSGQGPYPEDGPYAGPGDPGAPYAAPVAPRTRQRLTPEDAVTLIFKDGRPPEQIHNYMLTKTTLYVTDARRREIPVESLDLVATAKANRSAGVDFALPVEAR